MQWGSSLAFSLCAMILTSHAERVSVKLPEDKSPDLDPAAVYSGGKLVRDGAVTLLHDRMKQRNAVLKEQLKESITNLKELLQEEDAHLNERISKGLARLNGQLNEGDGQLKEDLTEDVTRLKERLTKGLNYLKEELEEGEAKTNKEVSKLKEAFGKRPCGVKQSDSVMMDDLRQQLTDFQAELNSTKHQLQTIQEKANSTEEELQETRQQLHEEQQAFTAFKAQLEQEIHFLKVQMDSVHSNYDLVSSEMGSTFIRWGRTTCPDNTSLVYSGYVGGQWWDHSGGGSNYLCLVMDPQLDNMTLPARYNPLHGAEYEDIEGQHEQDAVCSVCRAPQVTTLMIPATLSCPPGWTTQYRGHLVSNYYADKGRAGYVCLDEDREYRDGGQGEAKAANLFHVVSECDSLPCPPYAKRVVTCVVCST